MSDIEIQNLIRIISAETKDLPARIRTAIQTCLEEKSSKTEIADCVRKRMRIERLKDQGFHTTL